jgi:hypothetical protein
LGKLGRKVYCDYNKNVKCILLIKGRKRCIFDETTKRQHEKGEVQVGICALLPESERAAFLTSIKEKDYRNFRSWKD